MASGIYLIDHPQRDLPSIVWWAIHSKPHYTDKIWLLPTGEISPEVINQLRPDFIVWNYARPANSRIITYAHSVGVYNVIHDTEGIPYHLSSYWASASPDLLRSISEIWCWGLSQTMVLKSLLKAASSEAKTITTGSIRYEYVKMLPKARLSEKHRTFLWNTNYPLLNPRYQSIAKEYEDMVHRDATLTRDQFLSLVVSIADIRAKASESIHRLLQSNLCDRLIIRPHPFESSQYYEENFMAKYANVVMSTSSDVHVDLDESSLVLQSGCQTVLDAYLRGVPSLNIVSNSINPNIWSQVCDSFQDQISDRSFGSPAYLEKYFERQRENFAHKSIAEYIDNLYKPFNHRSEKLLEFLKIDSFKLKDLESFNRVEKVSQIKKKIRQWLVHLKRSTNPSTLPSKQEGKLDRGSPVGYELQKKAISTEFVHAYLLKEYGDLDWIEDGFCSVNLRQRNRII